jgi:DNA-binding XRE family transcriptional regulator
VLIYLARSAYVEVPVVTTRERYYRSVVDGNRGLGPAFRRMPPSPEDAALAEALRTLRKRSGLSQEDAAHAAGLHRAQYGRYEQGANAPTFVAVMKIARALGVSVSDVAAEYERLLAGRSEDAPR